MAFRKLISCPYLWHRRPFGGSWWRSRVVAWTGRRHVGATDLSSAAVAFVICGLSTLWEEGPSLHGSGSRNYGDGICSTWCRSLVWGLNCFRLVHPWGCGIADHHGVFILWLCGTCNCSQCPLSVVNPFNFGLRHDLNLKVVFANSCLRNMLMFYFSVLEQSGNFRLGTW